MSEETKKSGLVGKLALVLKSVDHVEKLGQNERQGYKYQRATDIAKAIRVEMANQNLMLIPKSWERSTEMVTTNSGGTARMEHLMGHFQFIDGDTGEVLDLMVPSSGYDSLEKGIYKAITGALKYAVKFVFMVPEDGDDPENEKPDRQEGIKAAQAVATEKLRSHARTNGGSELVTITPYKDGFLALSGPGVSIIRANMDNAMRAKFGWKQEGNVHMFVKEHKARMIGFCTEHQISVLDESAGAPIVSESRPTPGVTVDDMAATFGGTPTPFSDDPSTDPILLEAKHIKKPGKKEFLAVKWDGHEMSCFDTKLFADLEANVGNPAWFDWSSKGQYKNLLHIVRLGGQKYTPPAKTYSAQDSDVPF